MQMTFKSGTRLSPIRNKDTYNLIKDMCTCNNKVVSNATTFKERVRPGSDDAKGLRGERRSDHSRSMMGYAVLQHGTIAAKRLAALQHGTIAAKRLAALQLLHGTIAAKRLAALQHGTIAAKQLAALQLMLSSPPPPRAPPFNF